jgi:small subunit ribosomal protein S4
MGAPRRNRRQYEKPGDMHNIERIKLDHGLAEQYGLKNMKELWKVQTELSRLRRNVREMLSGNVKYKSTESDMMARLRKLSIASESTTLDNLLDLSETSLLERRLQTVVFRKGMARSIKQARQLIVHGYIAIDGRRVNRPGYIVDVEAEKHISYYKPIDIMPPAPRHAEAEQTEEQTAEQTAGQSSEQNAESDAEQAGEQGTEQSGSDAN